EYEPDPVVAMSEDTATVMNHLLQNVVYGAEGTGAGAGGYVPHMKIYAKTGTSNLDMDCWFTGGTPYYVGSSWCGYDIMKNVAQNYTARVMWSNVMSQVHSKLKAKEFTDSQYATSKYFCTETGELATENCTSRKLGWYRKSNIPVVCTAHPGELYTEKAEEPTETTTTKTTN
ncbi:MAG: hypothetical protein IJP26_00425, partial [Clostridia bacterium]|nr:hypothetical protein [Clostridia bacterium]